MFAVGKADHRCDVGFAVRVVQWAACYYYRVIGDGSGGEDGKGGIVAGHGQLAE